MERTAASAMAATSFFRCGLSAVLPLVIVQSGCHISIKCSRPGLIDWFNNVAVFENMGIGWASFVFGMIPVAMIPIPWILFVKGSRIRKRSNFETRVFDEDK